MAHDVFISHSVKDQTTADAMCAMLESEGICCWIAPRDVPLGSDWAKCIIDAIRQSRIMVLVFTANANASQQIHREVARAAHHDVIVVPFRVEDVVPNESLEFFIGNVQFLDALTPPLEDHLKHLAGNLKMLLARMEPREAVAVPQKPEAARAETAGPEPASATKSALFSPDCAQAGALAAADVPGLGELSQRASAEPREASSARELGESLSEVGNAVDLRPRKTRIWAWGGAVALALALGTFFAVKFFRPHPALENASQSVNGAQWIAVNSGIEENLIFVFGSSDGKRLWVAGKAADLKGAIWESDDGGTNWKLLRSDLPDELASISGSSDGKDVWVLSGQGCVVETHDWGANWKVESRGLRSGLDAIFATSDGKRVWAVGEKGAILESDDGGASWEPRVSNTKDYLSSIYGTSDGSRLWVAGAEGTIRESDDEGTTWTTPRNGKSGITSYFLLAIYGTSDGKHVWAAGVGGTVLTSDNGGGSWTPGESHTEGDINSIFGTSNGKQVWAVGDHGKILESDDGGANWGVEKSGGPNALHSIFGTSDGKHLWAVGDDGTILKLNNGG